MNETDPNELREAVRIYVDRYGKGQMDLVKLDEIIVELKNKKTIKKRKKK